MAIWGFEYRSIYWLSNWGVVCFIRAFSALIFPCFSCTFGQMFNIKKCNSIYNILWNHISPRLENSGVKIVGKYLSCRLNDCLLHASLNKGDDFSLRTTHCLFRRKIQSSLRFLLLRLHSLVHTFFQNMIFLSIVYSNGGLAFGYSQIFEYLKS